MDIKQRFWGDGLKGSLYFESRFLCRRPMGAVSLKRQHIFLIACAFSSASKFDHMMIVYSCSVRLTNFAGQTIKNNLSK